MRLADVQRQLRLLEQIEVEQCRQALTAAEALRDKMLGLISGDGPAQLEWIAVRTSAPARSVRAVAAAETELVERLGRLRDRSVAYELVARLHVEAQMSERADREAETLAETLERNAAIWQESATKD